MPVGPASLVSPEVSLASPASGAFTSCFYPDGATDGECAAGKYDGTHRETTAACTDFCTVGHYCEQGTGQPTPCPTGTCAPSPLPVRAHSHHPPPAVREGALFHWFYQ